MPTRSKTTRSTGRARKTTRTARARSSRNSKKGALPAVTVAAKQIRDTVNDVRNDPRKLKNIGKAAAVAAGVLTAGLLLKKR